ncbi:long-chain fatty acid--CoA ligase [Desulfobacterales bacterium HSG2]|nr:long-chain fatty acid--CoA ligase [Desulfobacterales bacterium HSG2]
MKDEGSTIKDEGGTVEFKDYQSVHQMLRETADSHSGQTAYRWFLEEGESVSVTWSEFYDQVKKVSKSLMALDVKKDDKVNILSYTCYRWVLCDLGITSAAACTVGIYHSNLAKDCKYVISHSDSVMIFVEDEKQLDKILDIREDMPDVRKVVLFKGTWTKDDDWIISFEEFLSLGKDVSDEDFQKRTDEISPDDPAGIVYTSGTTGVPKGAVLTHDNVTFTSQSIRECIDTRVNDEVFLFLPLAHVFARACAYTALLAGVATTFPRSLDTLVDDFKAARPHWFVSAPRIFEKIYSKVMSGTEAKGGMALKIFRWACHIGSQVSDYKLNKQPVPLCVRLQYQLADILIFSKVKAALGGRIRWSISGAAPLNPDIAKFFHAAGLLILEGIGMTENMSFSNVNRPDNYRFGWVGPPGPGIEQKTAEDGEILFRGRNVMKEYYKMPRETEETISPDGWLHTGDIGETDSENFLRITGRKKDIIVTAGGKNIAPTPVEGTIVSAAHIGQTCVIGDRRKYLSALVSLDPDTVRDYARENGIPFRDIDDLVKNENIIKLIESEVAEKNKSFASYETIKKITLVPEFTIENGMMTPTFKLKRNVIREQYKDEINAMYPDD